MARRMRCGSLIPLIGLGLWLAACGVNAEARLATDIGLLGGGHHELLLTVPEEVYHGGIFDQVPDFSLITGVAVEEYQGADRRGMRVRQSFFRLGQLSDDASAHFLNRAFPGDPFSYQARWRPGHLWRELEVEIFVNSSQSNALGQGFTAGALGLLDARYELHLPGDIVSHNGAALDNRTVEWAVDPEQPQVMSATARVVSVPFVISLLFTLVAIGWALGRTLAGRSPAVPRSLTPRPRATAARPVRAERPRRR